MRRLRLRPPAVRFHVDLHCGRAVPTETCPRRRQQELRVRHSTRCSRVKALSGSSGRVFQSPCRSQAIRRRQMPVALSIAIPAWSCEKGSTRNSFDPERDSAGAISIEVAPSSPGTLLPVRGWDRDRFHRWGALPLPLGYSSASVRPITNTLGFCFSSLRLRAQGQRFQQYSLHGSLPPATRPCYLRLNRLGYLLFPNGYNSLKFVQSNLSAGSQFEANRVRPGCPGGAGVCARDAGFGMMNADRITFFMVS